MEHEMIIVAVSMIKNELDIVEAFVRHTASFVDHHLVVDNGSTDGTRQMLGALADEGLPLTIEDDPVPVQWQAQRTTHLMRRARAEFGADWVLPLDTDEFLIADGDIREILSGQPAIPTFVSWRTYVPDPADDESEPNPVVRIRHRLSEEAHPWRKVLVPGSLALTATIEMGNHDLIEESGEKGARSISERMVLAHFPVRSAEQWATKVAIGNLAYLARSTDRQGLGFHYIEPYEKLREDWGEFARTYHHAARRFAVPPGREFQPGVVEEPLPYAGGPLRHENSRYGEPIRSILDHAAQLAGMVAEINGRDAAEPSDPESARRPWWRGRRTGRRSR